MRWVFEALLLLIGAALATSSVKGEPLYAANEDGLIYRSDDEGLSWLFVSDRSGPVWWMDVSPTDGVLYVFDGQCNPPVLPIRRSEDQGQTWVDGSLPPLPGQIFIRGAFITNDGAPVIFVENNDNYSLWFSEDKGDSWTLLVNYGPADSLPDGFISVDHVVGRTRSTADVPEPKGTSWGAMKARFGLGGPASK